MENLRLDSYARAQGFYLHAFLDFLIDLQADQHFMLGQAQGDFHNVGLDIACIHQTV